ncbi:hypothetical protein STVA_24790 [Allostella vacuolata]|nr:hypothetical protein STVA_24790 [Stella vacuolata]
MKHLLLASAMAALSLTAAAADAAAWDRTRTVTTPHGTYSAHGSGSCANGSCQRSYQATGPYGRTASRSGTVSRYGNHYDYSRTTTGPRGHSVTRAGSFRR